MKLHILYNNHHIYLLDLNDISELEASLFHKAGKTFLSEHQLQLSIKDNFRLVKEDLTEQEMKYCAYVFLEQAKSVKLGLGIAGGVSIAFLVVMCIAMISSMPEGGTFIALFTVLPFAIIIFPLFIFNSV